MKEDNDAWKIFESIETLFWNVFFAILIGSLLIIASTSLGIFKQENLSDSNKGKYVLFISAGFILYNGTKKAWSFLKKKDPK